MSAKPLHVQVAEALGWTETHLEQHGGKDGTPAWYGTRPADDHVYAALDARWFGVPRFDTDWSATGPLIERFGISILTTKDEHPVAYVWGENHYAVLEFNDLTIDGHGCPAVEDETTLGAVCCLILTLHTNGKLHRDGSP